MASVMLIVAVSRGALVPGYLAAVGLRSELDPQMASVLKTISDLALFAALGTAGIIISAAMVKGMVASRSEERAKLAKEGVQHG
jgi:uncharacterized membrane protein YgdD (TMEM256/DUF423 family)